MRLGVLVGIACGLAAYLALGTGKTESGRVAGIACANALAPPVREVPPQQLGPLREAVARVLPERLGRLYEEGTVASLDAWRDDDPAAPAVLRTAPRPAAYEMRWWAPNNDDVVADVFVFSTAERAARFAAQAAGGRCRERAHAAAAVGLPLARNLTWVNPDAFAEADVYVQRGARVYRIADVPAGQTPGTSARLDMSRTLITIDTLACLLPQAHCRRGNEKVVPA
jgi:hypothetical protein